MLTSLNGQLQQLSEYIKSKKKWNIKRRKYILITILVSLLYSVLIERDSNGFPKIYTFLKFEFKNRKYYLNLYSRYLYIRLIYLIENFSDGDMYVYMFSSVEYIIILLCFVSYRVNSKSCLGFFNVIFIPFHLINVIFLFNYLIFVTTSIISRYCNISEDFQF